jgi:hypothetical protein
MNYYVRSNSGDERASGVRVVPAPPVPTTGTPALFDHTGTALLSHMSTGYSHHAVPQALTITPATTSSRKPPVRERTPNPSSTITGTMNSRLNR